MKAGRSLVTIDVVLVRDAGRVRRAGIDLEHRALDHAGREFAGGLEGNNLVIVAMNS
jgi:hypothetical protein